MCSQYSWGSLMKIQMNAAVRIHARCETGRVLQRVRDDLAAVGHHVALGAPGAEHLAWVRERLGLPANVGN